MNDIDREIQAKANAIDLLNMDLEKAREELQFLSIMRDSLPENNSNGIMANDNLARDILNLLGNRVINPRVTWTNQEAVDHGERIYTVKFERWTDPSIRLQTVEGDQLRGLGFYISSLTDTYYYISRI